MEQLPYIDEHAMAVTASRERVWEAVVQVLRKEFGGSDLAARVLGCDPARGTPEFDGSAGQALPGFRVAQSERGHRLALEGRHRFSSYRLTVILDEGRVRAQTHAAFPGVLGQLYRAVVIGTGGHRLVTRRLLKQIAGRCKA